MHGARLVLGAPPVVGIAGDIVIDLVLVLVHLGRLDVAVAGYLAGHGGCREQRVEVDLTNERANTRGDGHRRAAVGARNPAGIEHRVGFFEEDVCAHQRVYDVGFGWGCL